MITIENSKVDFHSLQVEKLIYDFAKEMYFDETLQIVKTLDIDLL